MRDFHAFNDGVLWQRRQVGVQILEFAINAQRNNRAVLGVEVGSGGEFTEGMDVAVYRDRGHLVSFDLFKVRTYDGAHCAPV